MKKVYLGDAVYAEITPHGQLVITTEDGMSISNTIFLEPEVYQALLKYVQQIWKGIK